MSNVRSRPPVAARLATFILAVSGCGGLAAQPTGSSAHGLRGRYYTAHLSRDSRDYKGVDYDDDWLPIPRKPPDAERVDARIAFGKGIGFVLDRGKQREWFAAPMTAAVIWTGYIRFPAAGTYRLVTVSHNASAVYLNAARVSLCGGYGGVAVSPELTIESPAVNRLANPGAESYAVPIKIDAPRVLPIAVSLSMRNASSTWGFGIDLYWTTPDSPRDAQGKPVAEIVPTEALYPGAPQRIPPATVSAARSSLTADKLYYFQRMSKPVRLRVRLLDREGKPLAGRHVHLSALADEGVPEPIDDPPPTDADGATTARLAPDPKARSHVTKVFATAVDDWVNVAESVEVNIVNATSAAPSFFQDLYSPYYDSHALQIDPGTPVAGHETHFAVPLRNPLEYPVSVYVVLNTMEFNIGVSKWEEIARSARVTLQPGERHEFRFTWTPHRPASHQCFSAVVVGRIVGVKAQAIVPPQGRLAGRGDAATPPRFVRAAWRPADLPSPLLRVSRELLAGHFCSRGSDAICPGPDPDLQLIPDSGADSAPTEDTPLAETQRNLAVAGVANWAMQKLAGKYGSIPVGPVDFDVTSGRFSAGAGADLDINGHRVGGVDASASVGAEASSDPHKVLSATFDISANFAGYHATITEGTHVLPAPAISRDMDPAVGTGPMFSELRGLGH